MYTSDQLPAHARVWIYQADRQLTNSEQEEINTITKHFILNWAAHGQVLKATIELHYDRFLVIIVDEQHANATGCSIDKSFSLVKDIEQKYSVSLLDRLYVAYREGDKISSCMLDEFERKLQSNELTKDTIVFNNMVATKGDFESKWEVPVRESWHADLV